MSSLIRKYQQPLMIILTILTILIFVGYWNGPTGMRNNHMPHTADDIGKIYGNTITKTVLQREANKASLAYRLRLDLFIGLTRTATLTNQAVNDFAWNSIVLQHEADRLQLEPSGEAVHSDEGVAGEIKTLFQTEDGQFSPTAYADFVDNYLPSLGFTALDLEDLVAEDLRMKKIEQLLNTTFVVSQQDFLTRYTREYQKMDISVIHFNLADYAAKVQVTDDDIKKAFEGRLEGYHSEEKRGVKFVTFALTDEQKKLTGKDRVAALQKLANDAGDFTTALQADGAKFDDVAAKFKAPVTVVTPFPESAPDPKVPQDPDFVQTLFQLTQQSPVSEPLQDQDTGAYYVAQLQDVEPSRLLTLAEAKPQIITQVKNSRAQEQMSLQGREVRNKLVADLAAGKSFADAAKAEGLKAEAYPPSSPADPNPEKEDSRDITFMAVDIKEGDVSEFTPTENGGIIIHVDKREPIDPKQMETDEARLKPILEKQQLNLVFTEWLRKQHDAANIMVAGSNNGTPVPAPK